MHRFRFHFNTQYAIELREAINDRQKQSMVNIHKDRQIKGDYFAWDRTCAAMGVRSIAALLWYGEIVQHVFLEMMPI